MATRHKVKRVHRHTVYDTQQHIQISRLHICIYICVTTKQNVCIAKKTK